MIVVHVINDDGGVGGVIANLAQVQTDRGYKVIVVADGRKRFFERLPVDVDIRIVEKPRLPRMAVGSRISGLSRELKREFPGEDIVFHCHNVSTLGLLSHAKVVPLVVTVHGFSVLKDEGERLTRRERMAIVGTCGIIRKAARWGKPVFGVSRAVSAYWNAKSHTSAVQTIHNGCPDSGALTSPSEPFTIAHVGDLSRHKGWDTVLAAFLDLRRRHPDRKIRFISAGTPLHYDEEYLVDVRAKYGIPHDELAYLGFVKNPIQDVYSKAHVAVLDSKNEGLGLTLVEALSAGVPCIGSRAGGIPEIIDDGVNGELVDYGDVTQLVEAVERLMDANLWNEYSKAARRKYLECFSSEVMEDQYRSAYIAQVQAVKGYGNR